LAWLKRGPAVVGSVILGLFAVFNLLLSSHPKVVPLTATPGAIFLRNSQAYAAAADEALASSVLNRTKVTINTEHLTQALQSKFPELAHVTVSVPFIGSQPTVYIQPATPALLLSTTDGQLLVVDRSGRALLAAAQVPHIDKLGLPVVADRSGLSVQAGGFVLPSTSVSFITEVARQLKAKGLSITALDLPAGTSELDLKVSGVSYLVKYNLRGNARVEVGAFLAVKQQLEREHKTPGSYIDVRVEDRAYYR